jgi:hypothetical protein
MTKSKAAFLFASKTLGKQQLFLWTFTFRELLGVKDTRKRWNHLLTLLLRTWPTLQGLRVFELHESHGLHVHLITNQFIDVNRARDLATRAGWGRIHGRSYAERARRLFGQVSFERASGMFTPVATVGRLRPELGMDESQGCDPRNDVQPYLSSVQRMEGVDWPEGILRKNGFRSADYDFDDRKWLGGGVWAKPRRVRRLFWGRRRHIGMDI